MTLMVWTKTVWRLPYCIATPTVKTIKVTLTYSGCLAAVVARIPSSKDPAVGFGVGRCLGLCWCSQVEAPEVAPHPHPLLSKRAGGWRRDRLMGADGLANLFQPSTPSWNAERNGFKSMRRKIEIT